MARHLWPSTALARDAVQPAPWPRAGALAPAVSSGPCTHRGSGSDGGRRPRAPVCGARTDARPTFAPPCWRARARARRSGARDRARSRGGAHRRRTCGLRGRSARRPAHAEHASRREQCGHGTRVAPGRRRRQPDVWGRCRRSWRQGQRRQPGRPCLRRVSCRAVRGASARLSRQRTAQRASLRARRRARGSATRRTPDSARAARLEEQRSCVDTPRASRCAARRRRTSRRQRGAPSRPQRRTPRAPALRAPAAA